jgi:hypothetical protein
LPKQVQIFKGDRLSGTLTLKAVKDSAQKHPDITVVMVSILDIHLNHACGARGTRLNLRELARLLRPGGSDLRDVLSGWESILDIPEDDDGYMKPKHASSLQKYLAKAIPPGEEQAQILRGCIKLVCGWDGTTINRATT